MVEWWYPAFTALGAVLFGLSLVDAWPDRRRSTMVLSGLGYGLLLEQLTIIGYDAYVYPVEEYLVAIGDVPLAIGLVWAAILYAGFVTARRGGLGTIGTVAFVAVFALHIDLAMDAIAIRIPYWRWTEPGGWFGVPLGNFVGWFWVAAAYAGWWSLVDRYWNEPSLSLIGTVAVGGIAVPTTGLLLALAVYDSLLWEIGGTLTPAVAPVVLALGVLARANWTPHAASPLVVAVPISIHAFFLSVAIRYAFPGAIIGMGLVMLAVSGVIHAPPAASRRLHRSVPGSVGDSGARE